MKTHPERLISLLLTTLLTAPALAQAPAQSGSSVWFGEPARQTLHGTIEKTVYYCIALVGVNCPSPKVELVTDDGERVLVRGQRAGDLMAFDGRKVTVEGLRAPLSAEQAEDLAQPGPHPKTVIEADAFVPGAPETDFLTGVVRVAAGGKKGPAVYVDSGNRTFFVDDPSARQRLADADGATVTLLGEHTGAKSFRPTEGRFFVKGNVHARPVPLCLPGGPCGPFATHGIELPNGRTLEADGSGLEPDASFGRGESRWVELALDPKRPELFKLRDYSEPVWHAGGEDVASGIGTDSGAPGNNAGRFADTRSDHRSSDAPDSSATQAFDRGK